MTIHYKNADNLARTFFWHAQADRSMYNWLRCWAIYIDTVLLPQERRKFR